MVTGDLRMRVDGGEAVEATDLGRSMDDVAGFVERMAETISHLRIFARDSPEAPSVAVDLNEVVESSLKMIGMQLRNQGIEISLELTPDLPAIDGQPFQLEQVFLNLLANGRDAVNERADDGDKRLVVRTRRGGNGQTEVVAEVEDNGVGVAEEHLAHLFDPFYTTKSEEEGTGLGLSISYAIVRNHAGRIECTSQVGQGTLFRLQLPVSEPAG
jgi:C4-dicarboxylate-specific signal transduction histidine kinase